MVHGAVVHAEALIGNGATVLDGAVVGRRALVAAGATVPPRMEIPGGMLAVERARPGWPGRSPGGAGEWVASNPRIYRELARRHAASVHPIPEDSPA